jgi:hypothetical protein
MKRSLAASNQRRTGSDEDDALSKDQLPVKGSALLDAILASGHGAQPKGSAIGRLVDFSKSGDYLVEFESSGSRTPVPARSIIPLGHQDRGKEVVLLFDRGDAGKPIVMGLLVPRRQPEDGRNQDQTIRVEVDGESIEFNAGSQIVLRCGEASITLTKAGKILISGTYVLSRSSGLNRIKGGSIQLN